MPFLDTVFLLSLRPVAQTLLELAREPDALVRRRWQGHSLAFSLHGTPRQGVLLPQPLVVCRFPVQFTVSKVGPRTPLFQLDERNVKLLTRHAAEASMETRVQGDSERPGHCWRGVRPREEVSHKHPRRGGQSRRLRGSAHLDWVKGSRRQACVVQVVKQWPMVDASELVRHGPWWSSPATRSHR